MYLTGIILAVVEGKEFQQVHLCWVQNCCIHHDGFLFAAKIHIFRKTATTSKTFQPDFLIAAKLIHLVLNIVFEALDL
jgi:hypothetical protein